MKQLYNTYRLALALLFTVTILPTTQIKAQETGTMTDIDGNMYKTVKIGDQEWMAENLRVTRFSNGDSIHFAWGYADWKTTSLIDHSPARTIYGYESYIINDDSTNIGEFLSAFGFQYNHFALTDSRGIAPAGWKVPNEDDWKTLEKFAGMLESEVDLEFVAGGFDGWRGKVEKVSAKLRSTSDFDWDFNELYPSSDDYGFRWQAGSIRYADGTYEGFQNGGQNTGSAYRNGPVWSLTSSENVDTLAYRRQANWNNDGIQLRAIPKASGAYIRLIKDPNATSNEQNYNQPTEYNLGQNYPNPFNPSTVINFTLPESGHVTITVYDILGKEVSVLVDGMRPSGSHQVNFDGSHLSSGVYMYRMIAGNKTITKMMSLLK